MPRPSKTWLRSYGRIQGRALSPRKKRDLEAGLTAYGLPEDVDAKTLRSYLQNFKAAHLEIGMGNGSFLYDQARKNPETAFLGSEVFVNGIVQLCQKLKELPLANLKLYPFDARQLMSQLPAGSLDEIYLLFPDPWPKARHHKRRFIEPSAIDEFFRLLKPGGRIWVASDNAPYCQWTLDHFAADTRFEILARKSAQPASWAATRYQQKANNHRDQEPVYLSFRRI